MSLYVPSTLVVYLIALLIGAKLQHLLDLKQKQASLNIAIWTKREAQSAELQNVITFVFTTATVVFVRTRSDRK